MMDHAYVLIKEASVYVKEGEFFAEQGGLTADWGRAWERIEATSLYEARAIAIRIRRERFPHAHRIVGEGEPMELAWPEAAER